MKKMLIVFAVGVLIGAIIATGGVCVYAAVKNSNAKSEKSSTIQVDGMPSMNNDSFGQLPGAQNRENNSDANSQIPQLPDGQNGNSGQRGQNGSSFPGMPGGQNGQSSYNSQIPELPGNGNQAN